MSYQDQWSVTKWAIEIFHEWQATRGNKNCLEEQVGFKFNMNEVQNLNTDIADMSVVQYAITGRWYLCKREFYQICF